MEKREFIGVGRRKRAVASVRLRRGGGTIDINGRSFQNYFPDNLQRDNALAPLKKVEAVDKYDLIIRARGGGIEGQVVAVRLGIARALVKEDETKRSLLKVEGFLTRDPRKKERKKYGYAGARKSFQFSKR